MLGLLPRNYIVASSPVGKPHGKNVRPQEVARSLANFPKPISGDPFISYTIDKQVTDQYTKEIEKIKEQVRVQIVDTKIKAAEKLTFIDMVERLGVSYHFEKEIAEELKLISNEKESSAGYFDLNTAALQYRLFRQHGIATSSDIFGQFTDGNGKFKKSLKSDIRGLLNLLEAAYLRPRKDTILDEALIFSTNHLSSITESPCDYLEKQVQRALSQPICRAIPRFEARNFISIYEENELKNVSLLKLAKVDYNYSQLIFRQELSVVLRWWKELDIASKMQYGRDRVVEYYFFCLAMLHEPKYSDARIMLTKNLQIGTNIDDTYDSYGTLEELEIFTSAFQRWDSSEVGRLPEKMKILFEAFLKTQDELDQYAVQNGRPYGFRTLKKAWQEYAAHAMIQSNWFMKNELPPYPDFCSNALRLAGIKIIVLSSYMVTECPESVFDWLSHNPRMLVAAETIARLVNDEASHKFEKERGFPTPIDCYMKTYNVSEEEAKKKVLEMVEDAWKDLYEEFSTLQQTTSIPRDLLNSLISQVRIMDVAYKKGVDGWTDTQKSVAPFLNEMLMEPIPL